MIRIIKTKDANEYTIKGLTLGKLFTILHALDRYEESSVSLELKTSLEKEIQKIKEENPS